MSNIKQSALAASGFVVRPVPKEIFGASASAYLVTLLPVGLLASGVLVRPEAWLWFLLFLGALLICAWYLAEMDTDKARMGADAGFNALVGLLGTLIFALMLYSNFGVQTWVADMAGTTPLALAELPLASVLTWLPFAVPLGVAALYAAAWVQYTIAVQRRPSLAKPFVPFKGIKRDHRPAVQEVEDAQEVQPASHQVQPRVQQQPQRAHQHEVATSPAIVVPQGNYSKVDFSRRPSAPNAPLKSGPSFKDVIGMEDVKKRLLEAVDEFREHGGNGILLMGEPGNGKTFIAQALAGELGLRLQMMRAQEIVSQWMGEAVKHITAGFQEARTNGPVLLFLDEIDSLLMSRDGMGDGGSADLDNVRVVNALLTEMSSLNTGYAQHKVLLVAATNYPDKLDNAGTREKRFDAKVEIPPPEFAARLHLLKLAVGEQTWGRRHDEEVRLSLKRWEGWSVARIQHLGKIVAREVRKDPSLRLDAELLRRAIDINADGKGVRLSESAKGLDELFFTQSVRDRLDDLVQQLREPERLEALGVSLPRGAIFYGPAGTGKTATAQALTKAVGWRFLNTTGPSLLQDPAQTDKLIAKANDARPCIVFIDEAEGVLGKREDNPFGGQVTNLLLAAMDGSKKLGDVFFIAATNFADNLDEAMKRPGRFSEHFDFTPDAESLHGIVTAFIKSKPRVHWEGSVQDFVDAHPGASPAALIGLLDAAIRKRAMVVGKGESVSVRLEDVRSEVRA